MSVRSNLYKQMFGILSIVSLDKPKIETKEELGDRLCPYCAESVHGVMNTGPHNLCEGRFCDDAYEVYLEKEGE